MLISSSVAERCHYRCRDDSPLKGYLEAVESPQTVVWSSSTEANCPGTVPVSPLPQGEHSQHQAFVLDNIKTNLLGLTTLHLAVRTNSLQTPSKTHKEIPKSFSRSRYYSGRVPHPTPPRCQTSLHQDMFLYPSEQSSGRTQQDGECSTDIQG